MLKLPKLSVTEWAVLGTLATSASYGFAAARELGPKGSIGCAWTVPRPLVYRGIIKLIDDRLVAETGTAPGRSGPTQRLLRVTARGRKAFDSWLAMPVCHVRDYRSELMLKLRFLEDDPPRFVNLVRAQQDELDPILDGLRGQIDNASGFDGVLARWRLSSAVAANSFLSDLLLALPLGGAV